MRSQLKILREFMDDLDFIKMKPDSSIFKVSVPTGVTARALAETGRAYAIYLHHGKPGFQHNDDTWDKPRPAYALSSAPQETRLILSLPVGTYKAEWLNTKTGKVDKVESLSVMGGESTLVSPIYQGDIALRIKRRQP